MHRPILCLAASLFTFSALAYHPDTNPESSIPLSSFCADFSTIFDRSLSIAQPTGGTMEIGAHIVKGKIHTIRVGHRNTTIGNADIQSVDSVHPGNTYTFYKSRLNVQAMVSLDSDPDTYYGVRILNDESPCSLNELARFNLLQTAYENDLSVQMKVAKINPFKAFIGLNEEGYFDQTFDLKYGYIFDVEITDPAPPEPAGLSQVVVSAAFGSMLGAGVVGFMFMRRISG